MPCIVIGASPGTSYGPLQKRATTPGPYCVLAQIVDLAVETDTFPPEDGDAILAAANMAERAGATAFDIGHSDPDAGPVTWYAAAEYGPAVRIQVDGLPGPAEAAMALARRLLTGAKCRCGSLVALSEAGAFAPPASATMLDGSDPRALRGAEHCLWILEGARWEPGCDAPPLTVDPGFYKALPPTG